MDDNETIDKLIENLTKIEKKLEEEFINLSKGVEKINNPLEYYSFLLDKIIPSQIKGIIVMDRLNLLTGLNIFKTGLNPEESSLYKYALDLTSNSGDAIKKNLESIRLFIDSLKRGFPQSL